MYNLRHFQSELNRRTAETHLFLRHAYPQKRSHVLQVAPTGSGKTVMMGDSILKRDMPQLALAHRQELVGQISKSLALCGIRHGIIAPDNVVSSIRRMHLDEVGANFVAQNSHVRVAGVDTLVARGDSDPWLRQVQHVDIDEAHHVQKENKWGRSILMLPNANSTGWTATSGRADGRGLGEDNDGIYQALTEGPKSRHLIQWGFLTDYRYVCETVADLDLSKVALAADGDYNKKKLSTAVHASKRIIGDVVDAYLKWGSGKLGITFATDIEAATEYADAFRRAGVAAEVVTGKTPDGLRQSILARFRRGDIKMLVNVDLFGEGFDVPAVEIVILARPTKSFSLYAQQVGRVLRIMVEAWLAKQWGSFTDGERLAHIAASRKPVGIVVDLVGNVFVHGVPDSLRRKSTLERRAASGGSRERDPDVIPQRMCTNVNPLCLRPYERHLTSCPYCGFSPEPGGRSSPEQVDGDVGELSTDALRLLRGEVEANLAPPKYPFGASGAIRAGIWNRHQEKVSEIGALQHAMSVWGAGQSALSQKPLSDREQARLFYLTFGMDILTAQSLKRAEAQTLREKIERIIAIDNIRVADNNAWNSEHTQ